MTVRPRTLYGRMLLVSASATLVALVVAGLVIGAVLGRFVTEGLDRRLDAQVLLLSSTIDAEGRVDRALLGERLAALDGGPGWRWRIAGPDGSLGSGEIAAPAGPPQPPPPPPPGGPAGLRPLEGAQVHARTLTLQTRRGPVTLTAAAPRAMIRTPIRGALAPLLGALAALAALLTAALLVQLRVGLRPLRALQEEVAAIRAGREARVSEDQPAELRPLAEELNALATDNAAALAAARGSAANLAHALKTPVATLAIELGDRPREAALVARIDRTIRHHLARARADAIDRRSATALAPAVADIAAVVRRLGGDAAPQIATDIADVAMAVEAQDLDELLGNLLDNAARHANACVWIGAVRDGRMVRIEVADDGPGIPDAERARVGQPGLRLDERGDGHGFGLSIVAELVSLYGGAMVLDAHTGGGLVVRVSLPAAQ